MLMPLLYSVLPFYWTCLLSPHTCNTPAGGPDSPSNLTVQPLNTSTPTRPHFTQLTSKLTGSVVKEPLVPRAVIADLEPLTLHYNNRPVYLVPGTFSSQLLVSVSPSSPLYVRCANTTARMVLWYNHTMFTTQPECMFSLIQLPAPPGVNVTVNPSVSSLEYLDHHDRLVPSQSKMPYMTKLVAALRARGLSNLNAVPYDFRMGFPYLQTRLFPSLRSGIEQSVKNSKKRAVLVCHSMGCRVTLSFLQLQSLQWKDNNIERLVSISGAYGGSICSVQAITVGYSLNMDVPPPYLGLFHTAAISFPSTYYILPDPAAFPSLKPLVVLNGRNYTVADYRELLTQLGQADRIPWLIDGSSPDGVQVHQGPDVRVDCFYNDQIKTVDYVILKDNANYTLHYGRGDGTVNVHGLELCRLWKKTGANIGKVMAKTYEGDHNQLLLNTHLLKHLSHIIANS